jgi:hypothetical protein
MHRLRQEAYDALTQILSTLLSPSPSFYPLELLPLRCKQKSLLTANLLIRSVLPVFGSTKSAADYPHSVIRRWPACHVLAEKDEGRGHPPDPEKCQAREPFSDVSQPPTGGPSLRVVAVFDRHQL